MVTARKKKKCTGCLAYAVRCVFTASSTDTNPTYRYIRYVRRGGGVYPINRLDSITLPPKGGSETVPCGLKVIGRRVPS